MGSDEKTTCAALVSNRGARRFPCERRRVCEVDDVPLCGVHLNQLRRHHVLVVAHLYGGDEGVVRLPRPKAPGPRWRLGKLGERLLLEQVQWEDGAAWEAADPDELAVRRAHLERLGKHGKRLAEQVERIADEMAAQRRRIHELEQAALVAGGNGEEVGR